MENFRSALQAAQSLPDAQAEDALRGLLKSYPTLPPEDEGKLRYSLGVVLFQQNRNTEAREELRRSSSLLEPASGQALALALTALARVEIACNDVENSVRTGRRALELLRRCLPADDPRLAPSLFALSFGEYMARNLGRAEALNLEAKELWERQRGPESLEVSTCLNNLGRIYEEMDRYDEGIAHHKAALAIRLKVLGDHPETAFSLGNLGTALASAGRWQEAADTLEKAIACYARCGQTEGPGIEGYRSNLNICKAALAQERA